MILILICFFLSGLTGLVYEILWTRMIVNLIGGAPFAVSIILTVFMGGLGLGSYIVSRVIHRIKEPAQLVRIYGILELMIGLYGLALPLLLLAFEPLYGVLYNQLYGHFMLYNLLTFLGCCVLLCIPVICMGATLPILCQFYVTRLSHLGTHAGRLYGLNTIGAALGALLSGFWLINILGVNGTLTLVIIINGVIGLFCILVSHQAWIVPKSLKKNIPDPIQPSPTASESLKSSKARVAALIVFAVSGFSAMAYEVIWAKLLGLIVGPTTYSFTIVLVTFILGLALGSMFWGWLGDRVKETLWLLLFTQIIAAFFVLIVSQLLGNSQFFFAKLLFHYKDDFILRHVIKAALLFVFMLIPTFSLGATFPLVGKIYTQSVVGVGKSLGFAYAINTIGAVLGSFSAGFILIPLVGKENGLRIVIGLQLLTSLVILGLTLPKDRKRSLTGLLALTGLLLSLYFPMWNHLLLSSGKYHRFNTLELNIKSYGWLDALINGSEILTKQVEHELVYYGDGIGGFTTVLKYEPAFGEDRFVLANSGKPDASSHGDMSTQTLMAHVPLLFHRDAKKVMVIGMASGTTAGEILHYPIDELDVLDINKQVVKASSFFERWNNKPLSNPKTNLIIQDGRAHLNLTTKRYDIIISEPSNPWMAGLASLFTSDFFTLAKEKLNKDGIFIQFMHSYQMDWATFALVGRTFHHVFPNSIIMKTAHRGLSNDYIFIGFTGKSKLSLDNAKKNLSYSQLSKNVFIANPEILYRFVVTEDLKKLFGPGPVNTDSSPQLEFAAPKLIYKTDYSIRRNLKSKKWLSDETKAIAKRAESDIELQIDYAAYSLSINTPFPYMVDLSKVTPEQKLRFYDHLDKFCSRHSFEVTSLRDRTTTKRCFSVQINAIEKEMDRLRNNAPSWGYLGYLYHNKGKLDKAISCYLESLRIDPENPDVSVRLGTLMAKKNRFEEALKYFTKVLKINPDSIKARKQLGYVLAAQNKLGDAIKEYKKALVIEPNNPLVLTNIGALLSRQDNIKESIDYFKKALKIDSDSISALNSLSWVLSTRKSSNLHNPKEAVKLAKQASDITHYESTVVVDTLAAAYAAAGNYPEAITMAQKALDLSKRWEQKFLTDPIQKRLNLYKEGKPYYENMYISREQDPLE